MDKKDIETAKKYKKELIELGVPISAVFVFGSRARNMKNKWSDLDICVVSPVFEVDRQSERVFLMNIGRKVSDDIEPHPMTEKELKNIFNPLANEIRRYGIAV